MNLKVAEKYDHKDIRIKKMNLAMQCWTFRRFTFFEALEKTKELGIQYIEAYPGQTLSKETGDLKFNHDMTDEQIKMVKDKLRSLGLNLVNYGVVGLGKTETSMRKVFDFARKMRIQVITTEPEFDDFELIDKLVREYNVKIAIHNHPKPSRYWNPETVLENIRGKDLRIGACADDGHWMRSGITPIEAFRMLEGRITSMHIKDRNDFGTSGTYDVPVGYGKADIKSIFAELTRQDFHGYISFEYENEDEVNNPMPALKKSMEYIKSITYFEDYEQILRYGWGNYSKHGWNHYGPGYFDLDRKTGVLKSVGGMGLFWYSAKKYKDFILELDFKVDHIFTNSGIFLRVPEMPESDNYIYHSFEVQIYDQGKGIHKTGAVYDADAPSASAFYEPGKWNHYKITLKDQNYKVELNGKLIIDWMAEPRGKIRTIPTEGYIGLQNHDWDSHVYFRNIYVKELK
jgi:sugar phosphate isomerase/epimerase